MKIITKIELQKVEIMPYFAALLSIIIVRNFLENILEASHLLALELNFYLQVSDFFHITLSWLMVFATLILVISLFADKPLTVVAKPVLVVFPVIILVPILDYFYFGSGAIFYQSTFESFWFSYLHLFDPYASISYITNGVRVEILIAVILSFIYVYQSTSSFVRALAASFAVYSSVYFYGYLPAIYNCFFSTSVDVIIKQSVLYSRSPVQLNFLIYIPLFLLACTCIYFSLSGAFRRGLWISIRIERLTVYLLLTLSGVVITALNGVVFEELFNLYDLLKLTAAIISVACAFIYSVIINDIHDYKVDCISNKNRPLVTGDIKPQDFSDIKTVMLVLSCFFAVPVNEHFIFVLLFILALSHLYSCPPFRLRRIFIVGHFTLALIGLTCFLQGACLVDGLIAFSNADISLLSGLLCYFFIASHFKDIKDIKGDRSEAVVTLATLIGAKPAYFILSSLFSVILVILGFIFSLGYLPILFNVLLFVSAAIYFRDSEKILFVIQVCSAGLFISYVYMQFNR